MKRTHKGFTLVELLIVMGIMGILGAMVMIGGQQASDAARGTAIADSLEKAAAAMQAYYIDNAASINVNGTKAAKVAKGASAYLSETLVALSTPSNLTAGQYGVYVTTEDDPDANWYLVYKLVANEAGAGRNVKAILASKAERMNLRKTAVEIPAENDNPDTDEDESKPAVTTEDAYDGESDTVYMLVR